MNPLHYTQARSQGGGGGGRRTSPVCPKQKACLFDAMS